jgi:hypothetical protein
MTESLDVRTDPEPDLTFFFWLHKRKKKKHKAKNGTKPLQKSHPSHHPEEDGQAQGEDRRGPLAEHLKLLLTLPRKKQFSFIKV